jgi:hypothetical protein
VVARARSGETPIAKRHLRQQHAALPLTVTADGQRMVMLVTSRETRGFTPAEAASVVDESGLAAILRGLDALQADAVVPSDRPAPPGTANLLARRSAVMTWGELALAERCIAEAQAHLTDQRQHIERRAVLGQDTSEAEVLRHLLEQFLAIAQAYRWLVLKVDAGGRPA